MSTDDAVASQTALPPAAPGSAATLLQLIWLASPALPVGGYSYSEGLEAAIESGTVASEAQAGTWLVDQFALTLARAELPVLAAAVTAWQGDDGAGVADLNGWVRCTRESAELRAQSEQMGRSLLEWLRNAPGGGTDPRVARLAALVPAPTWTVAFALAAARAGASPRDALLAYAFGWAENMVQAAMKAMPLGQAAAQRILSRLTADIPGAVEQSLQLPLEARQSYAPMLAIHSAQHETQYSRLFRS